MLPVNCGSHSDYQNFVVENLQYHDKDGNIVYHDMYEYSWPAVLERLTGTVCHNYNRTIVGHIDQVSKRK